MQIVVIDPRQKLVRTTVASLEAARNELLGDPIAIEHLSERELLIYQPLACAEGAPFFFSRKLEQHYAGLALVTGASVDGYPVSCGPGVLEAVKKDILFLGDIEQARRTLSQMVKFAAGSLEPKHTPQ